MFYDDIVFTDSDVHNINAFPGLIIRFYGGSAIRSPEHSYAN